jgi:sorbitol-6-phosphate 2-dehydrogenase
MASEGCRVAIADIQEDKGRQRAGELTDTTDGSCIFYKTDISKPESNQELVERVNGEYGTIDVLVNNAGVLIPRLLVDPAGNEEIEPNSVDKMVSVNLKGSLYCTQAVVRHMIRTENEGVIINMASESGLEGSRGQSVYAATKAALYSFSRSWAKELGEHGIRVVGVAPGILEKTGLRDEEYERSLAYSRGMTVEELRQNYKEVSVPLGRVGELDEVADVVCFLASDMASYITGTVINISGGKSRA